MTRDLAPSDTFAIAFDTNDMPGKVKIVKVTIAEEIMDLKPFDGTVFRIDLADHPLYRHLCAYCANNPPRDAA